MHHTALVVMFVVVANVVRVSCVYFRLGEKAEDLVIALEKAVGANPGALGNYK